MDLEGYNAITKALRAEGIGADVEPRPQAGEHVPDVRIKVGSEVGLPKVTEALGKAGLLHIGVKGVPERVTTLPRLMKTGTMFGSNRITYIYADQNNGAS